MRTVYYVMGLTNWYKECINNQLVCEKTSTQLPIEGHSPKLSIQRMQYGRSCVISFDKK